MAYCTIQQLEDRLTAPVLGMSIPESGADKARVLGGYIERAGARIDALLSVKYATPVASSPLLADICLSLCLWQIEADRGITSGDLAPRVQVPYNEAMKMLGDLASGAMALPGAPVAEGFSAGLVVQSPTSLFAADSPGMEFF